MTRRRQWIEPVAIAVGLTTSVLVHASHSVSPAQAPPVPKGTGAIFGQVLEAGSGQPIAEAVVTLTDRSLPRGAAAQPQRVLTDMRGRFLFHDLSKGPFGILAIATGYRSDTPLPAIPLEDGQRINDFRIRLTRSEGAVVTGMVFDEADDPVVGVEVQFAHPGEETVGMDRAMTDDRGIYRTALAPGDWVLAVRRGMSNTWPTVVLDAMLQAEAAMPKVGMARDQSGWSRTSGTRVGELVVSSSAGLDPVVTSGGRLLAYQSVFYPASASAAQATVITLKPGEYRSGLDLHLRLVPTFSVSGTVTWPNGSAANTTVELDGAMTRTLADGTFTFLALPQGAYVARVIKEPSLSLSVGADPSLVQLGRLLMGDGFPSEVLLFAEAPVVVAETDVTGVTLALREGLKVTGRLQFDGTQPAPIGPQLQMWDIGLTPEGRGSYAQPNVDQDGQFKTLGRVSGRYWVNADRLDLGKARQWFVKSVLVAGRDVTDEGVELKDADVNDAVVVLTDKVSTVSGVVLGGDGKPAARGTVFILPAGYKNWMDTNDMRNQRVRQAPVLPSGAYSIGNLVAGSYLLAASDDAGFGGVLSTSFFPAFARVATAIKLGESDGKIQDLQLVKIAR